MVEHAVRPAPTRVAAGLITTLGASYVVSQLLRNSIGVLAPTLAAEIRLSAAELALVTSVFLFVFVLAQIPLGIAIDRFGPKRCMLACAGVAVAGTLLFAAATDFIGLIAARALMGIGTSCYLMAPLAFYAHAAPHRFAALTGLHLAAGATGSLLATAPLAFAADVAGWRECFAVVAVSMAAIGIMIAFLMPDSRTPGPQVKPESLADGLRGVRAAFGQPDVGKLFLMDLTVYAGYALVVGLWGGPYLTHVYGYDLTARGNLLFAAALAQAVGMLAWGSADRILGGYKPAMLLGGGSTALLLFAIALCGVLPTAALWAWMVAFGFCSAFLPVAIAHGRTLFPPELLGRGITLLNMATIGGGFLSQSLSGLLIDLFETTGGVYPLAAYRAVFFAQSALGLAGLAVYWRTREPTR